MDFHNSSLALNEWLEWTEDYIRKPEPVKAHYCEAKNPSTNEVIWDDLLYSDEDKIKRLEDAYNSGLILVISPKAETIYEA